MMRRRAMQPENANDNNNKNNNEEVGFGRPPTQFKPGQSGNPKGRPKGRSYPSTEEALARVAHEKREVKTRKGARLVSAFELGVNAMVKSFLEKDVRAAIMFLRLCEEYEVASSEIFPSGVRPPFLQQGMTRREVAEEMRAYERSVKATWMTRTEEFVERKQALAKIAGRRSRLQIDGKWRRRTVLQMAYYVICNAAAQGDLKAFEVMHDVQRRYGVTQTRIEPAPRGSAEERKEIVEDADRLKRYRRRYGSL
jgi:hypothetical protein